MYILRYPVVNKANIIENNNYQTPGVPGGPKHFSEVEEASECLSSLEIFLFDLYKTLWVTGGPKHFSEAVEAFRMSCKLVNIFV